MYSLICQFSVILSSQSHCLLSCLTFSSPSLTTFILSHSCLSLLPSHPSTTEMRGDDDDGRGSSEGEGGKKERKEGRRKEKKCNEKKRKEAFATLPIFSTHHHTTHYLPTSAALHALFATATTHHTLPHYLSTTKTPRISLPPLCALPLPTTFLT